jgi:hypothetical protein
VRGGAGVPPWYGRDSKSLRAFEREQGADRQYEWRQLRHSQVHTIIIITTTTTTTTTTTATTTTTTTTTNNHDHIMHRQHSSVTSAEQQRAFQAVPVGTLKVAASAPWTFCCRVLVSF